MVISKPNPEDPFSKRAWYEFILFIPILVLFGVLLYGFYIHYQNISAEVAYNQGIKILWLVGLCTIPATVHGWYQFSVCKSKHLELLERYGDDYKTLLKEKLNYSSIRGSMFVYWQDYEEDLKRMKE